MRTPKEYDEIRPYDEEERTTIIEQLIADPEFRTAAQYAMPGIPYETLCTQLRACTTIHELQTHILQPILDDILNRHSNGFTLLTNTIDNKQTPHTYISNHRDIVLDPALLSLGLIRNGFPRTTQIAIGDNLLIRPWIKKLVRLNKAFIVKRHPRLRETLTSSTLLSNYMHYTITVKHDPIWIAQREGRAKDANDRTQLSILKMMTMGGQGTLTERLRELNIVPIALSYEYDPCDYLKAKELQQKRDNPNFKKTTADDLNSMKTGIYGYKGKITFRTANPLNPFIDTLPHMPKNQLFTTIAQHIDREIHSHYTLYPVNYIAADRLTHTTRNATHYTHDDITQFDDYIAQRLAKIDLPNPDIPFLSQTILTMYANPVFNQQAIEG